MQKTCFFVGFFYLQFFVFPFFYVLIPVFMNSNTNTLWELHKNYNYGYAIFLAHPLNSGIV